MIPEQELLKLRQTTIQELIDFFSEDKEICDQFRRISNNETRQTIAKILKQRIQRKKERTVILALLLGLINSFKKRTSRQNTGADRQARIIL